MQDGVEVLVEGGVLAYNHLGNVALGVNDYLGGEALHAVVPYRVVTLCRVEVHVQPGQFVLG